MAEPKVLNTRIQLKIDTIENWNAHPKVELLPGEVAIAIITKEIPPKPNKDGSQTTSSGTTTEFMMKVGRTKINTQGQEVKVPFDELEWVSAKAADVYEWAKAANFPLEPITSEDTDEDQTRYTSDGSYVRDIWWDFEKKKLKYNRQVFETSIPASPTDNNAPTTKAVKEYVDEVVTGAVQYWGVIDKPEDLGKDMTISGTPEVKVGKGDFYRVGKDFEHRSTGEKFKAGDLLISNSDDAGSGIENYYRLAQESGEGTVTSIEAGTGLSTGSGDKPIKTSGTISLKQSTATEIGGGKATLNTDAGSIKTTTVSGKNYAVQITKGGTYYVNVPWTDTQGATVNNGGFTVSGGNGLTGSGSMTANQADNTSATLAVGAGNGITVATDSVSVTDYDNILTAKGTDLATEKGVSIILCGGDSNI